MKLIIVGAGGHGRVCAEIAEETGRYAEVGFSDPAYPVGSSIANWQVVCHDEELGEFSAEEYEIFVGIGQIGTGSLRRRLFESIEKLGHSIPVLVSESSLLSRSASLGAGTVISRNAVVNTAAGLGRNVIVNTGCIVDHDAAIGDHVHLSTGAIVNGGCSVGAGSMIGSGAVLLQGVSVGEDVVVGAGAVVTKDIRDAGTYLGVPARRLNE